MMPPIFSILSGAAGVTAFVGAPPRMRLFPFGEADQATLKPYITWQLISGLPENYLGQLPDVDRYRTQVDIWAETQAVANEVAEAVRDALEPHAYILGSGNTIRDADTRCFRYMLDVEFITPRAA